MENSRGLSGFNFFTISRSQDFSMFESYPEFELVFSSRCKIVRLDEVRQYLKYFCQKDNYLLLLKTLFSLAKEWQFDNFYEVSPIIPKELWPIYKKMTDANDFMLEDNLEKNNFMLEEKRNKSFYSL